MAYEEKTRRTHAVTMENRQSLKLTGVSDVDSFDDTVVVVYTDYGELVIRGRGLKIGLLSVVSGDLTVSGEVASLTYMDQQKPAQGLLGKLFR